MSRLEWRLNHFGQMTTFSAHEFVFVLLFGRNAAFYACQRQKTESLSRIPPPDHLQSWLKTNQLHVFNLINIRDHYQPHPLVIHSFISLFILSFIHRWVTVPSVGADMGPSLSLGDLYCLHVAAAPYLSA